MTTTGDGRGERPHILVVDDDPDMREYLRGFLAGRGYDAETVGSAEEAVARYREQRPAAVILDVVMPGGMDGLAALAAFKKIDRDVPVIVLSGQGRTSTVVQAMKLGASDFVGKPFDEADLDGPLEQRAAAPPLSSRGGVAARTTAGAAAIPACCSAQARGWPRCASSSSASPTPTSRCSSAAKAAPARSWSRGRSVPPRSGATSRSSR